jgi:hypothetical protein
VRVLKKILLLAVILLLAMALAGCGGNQDAYSFSGMVFAVEEGRVLVVADIENADIPYEEWFEAGKRAIWFSVDKKTAFRDAGGKKISYAGIEAGQEVEVFFTGPVMESYPEQTKADKIVILREVP